MYLVQKKNLYTIESVTALFNSKTDAKYWFRKIENTVIIQETTINLLTPKIWLLILPSSCNTFHCN